MKKPILITIEASKDYFDAYAENIDGIYGAGTTIEACKADIENVIELQRHSNPCNLPKWVQRGDYTIEYKLDTQSLLNYYSRIITMSALAKRAGINPKQMQHYSSGLTKPRPAQRAKIVNAINTLGREMISVQ